MILATAGHIDHGKTALVRALTGIDADRLPEEKRRGLTIDLGFAYARLPDGSEIGFVDVPGHERFLPNMLAGVLSIDRVLLIVAADDGPRPQTREHLDILDLIGVAEVTGVVTKIDRVEPARAAAVIAEVRIMLAEAGFTDAPVFAVSSTAGSGIAALTEHLQRSARVADQRRAATPPAGLFRMPIDRAFTLTGIGLVVTGTVAAGVAAIGDRLVLSPQGDELRVRGLHAQNRPVAEARAGERCAINIAGASAQGREPRRGDWILAPERHAPARRLDLELRASRFADGLRSGLPVHLHLGTADVVARATVLGGRTLAPGETGFVQVEFDEPLGALWGDRAVLRDHAARRTLAGGRVVDPFPPRRGRSQPQRLAALRALAEPDPAAALAELAAVAGAAELSAFALARNLAPAVAQGLPERCGLIRTGRAAATVVLTRSRLASLREQIVVELAEWHRQHPDTIGPTTAALLARRRGDGPAAAVDAALAALLADGQIAQTGGMWRLAGHAPRLAAPDERLWRTLLPRLEQGGLRPPRVRELADAVALPPAVVERLLVRAAHLGRVVRIADNRFFLPATVDRLAELARRLAEAAPDGQFTAAEFKDLSGVGRNVAIEILEHLDRTGITRRVGNARALVTPPDRAR